MNAEDFLIEVKKEVEHLRKNTTQEEKDRLDFDSFDFSDYQKCIYGQMTGHCSSKRAIELYPKSIDSLYFANEPQSGNNFTCLERYLLMVTTPNYKKSKMHEDIINYIKGDTDMIYYQNIN